MTLRRHAAALAALVSLWGCNAILGIEGATRRDGAPGGAGEGGGDGGAAGGDGRSGAPGRAGEGQGGEAPAAPCAADEEPAPGVFVDPRVGDDANEGSLLRPLQTLTRAANEAIARRLDTIYLAPGSYQEALSLRVAAEQTPDVVSAPEGAALTFEGGWRLDGARWRRDCAPDAREKTVIASPSTAGVSIRGAFGPLAFRNLSIATATDAPPAVEGQPGGSCYGVHASGDGLRLRFDNVEIDACPGGKGGSVAPATAPPAAACVATGAECADGSPGADAAGPGLPARPGAFDVEGFRPGVGDPGARGAPGAAGVRGPGEVGPRSCGFNDTACCGSEVQAPHGRCGCGGEGGAAGPGGPGGGASVALFVQGTKASVDLAFTTLRARAGGEGGLGGDGGPGSTGAPGSPYGGFAECCDPCGSGCQLFNCTALPAQPAGGQGGPGGKGSRGGGGSGGPSFGVVTVGDVALAQSQTVLSFGRPGAGAQGAPAGEAGAQAKVTPPPP